MNFGRKILEYIKFSIRVLSTIFLVSLFVSISYASNPPTPSSGGVADEQKTNNEKPETKSNTNKNLNYDASSTTPIKSLPIIQPPPTAKPENHNFFSPEWWIVYFSGFLAVVTAILALYTGKLFRATVSLSKDSKETYERQRSLERPWLFIDKIRVERREGAPIKPDLPNNWWISFIWKNIGRSPAFIESCIFNIESTDNLSEIPDYTNAGELTCPSTIAAGAEFETNKVGPAPEKGIKDGKPINLSVYGKLIYKELDGTQHHTGYAVDVSPHLPCASTSKCKNYEYHN